MLQHPASEVVTTLTDESKTHVTEEKRSISLCKYIFVPDVHPQHFTCFVCGVLVRSQREDAKETHICQSQTNEIRRI